MSKRVHSSDNADAADCKKSRVDSPFWAIGHPRCLFFGPPFSPTTDDDREYYNSDAAYERAVVHSRNVARRLHELDRARYDSDEAFESRDRSRMVSLSYRRAKHLNRDHPYLLYKNQSEWPSGATPLGDWMESVVQTSQLYSTAGMVPLFVGALALAARLYEMTCGRHHSVIRAVVEPLCESKVSETACAMSTGEWVPADCFKRVAMTMGRYYIDFGSFPSRTFDDDDSSGAPVMPPADKFELDDVRSLVYSICVEMFPHSRSIKPSEQAVTAVFEAALHPYPARPLIEAHTSYMFTPLRLCLPSSYVLDNPYK